MRCVVPVPLAPTPSSRGRRRNETLGVPAVVGTQPLQRLGEQPRLANAGLAGEQHAAAFQRQQTGLVEQFDPSDEPRPHADRP